MSSPTLRSQLEKKPAPAATASAPAAPSSAASEAAKTAQCFTVVDSTLGVKFKNDDLSICFPYAHFLFCELVGTRGLIIRFSTHRIMIIGENVEILLDEFTTQRLSFVRTMPKRFREQAGADAVWIERMEITEEKEPAEGELPAREVLAKTLKATGHGKA